MTKMNVLIFSFLLFFVLVFVFSLSFLLSSPLVSSSSEIKIIREIGNVSVKYYETETYVEVLDQAFLNQGDEIKTSSGAKAVISFYDNSEVVLDENSELVISQALVDKNSPFLSKITLKLKTGQVWSRLQTFLNPEALFEIEAEDVVATVRGTSFNVLNREKVVVSVFENKVEVKKQDEGGDTKEIVEKNKKITFLNSQDKTGKTEDVYFGDFESDWLKNNLLADKDFKIKLLEKNLQIVKENKIDLSEKFNLFSNLGENLRLFFTFDKEKKDNLKNNFDIKKSLLNLFVIRENILEDLEKQENSFEIKDSLDLNLENKEDLNFEKEVVLTSTTIINPIIIEEKEVEKDLIPEEIFTSSIKIISPKKIITFGEALELQVLLLLSDKTEKDITKEVVFDLSVDDLTGVYAGDLRENIFIANQNGGLAYISASYKTEENIILRDKIILTVLTY